MSDHHQCWIIVKSPDQQPLTNSIGTSTNPTLPPYPRHPNHPNLRVDRGSVYLQWGVSGAAVKCAPAGKTGRLVGWRGWGVWARAKCRCSAPVHPRLAAPLLPPSCCPNMTPRFRSMAPCHRLIHSTHSSAAHFISSGNSNDVYISARGVKRHPFSLLISRTSILVDSWWFQ